MMRRRYSLASSLLFTVLLLAGAPESLRAQNWYEHYANGLEALRREQFRDAVDHFTRAIDQRPESKASARTYGVRFIDYFPYVYRGIAYARLGEPSPALSDFEHEHAAGEVYNGKRDTQAGAVLRQRLEEYRTLASAHASLREPLASGESTTSPSAPPRRPAADIQRELDSLYKAAVTAIEDGRITAAKPLFQEVRKRRPSYPGLHEYETRIRGFEQTVRKGIGAYLRGTYKQSAELLQQAAETGRDHAAAQAFLGCSHTALYLLSGRQDNAELDRAVELFRTVRRIDPRFTLDSTFISPAIRDVFRTAAAD